MKSNKKIARSRFVTASVGTLLIAVCCMALVVRPSHGQTDEKPAEVKQPVVKKRSSPKVSGTRQTTSNSKSKKENARRQSPAAGNDKKVSAPAKKPLARKTPAVRETPAERKTRLKQNEQKAFAFVKEHHPELIKLLQVLKRQQRPAYDRVVRDLAADSERLNRIQERLPDRYDLALAAWKLDSRIQLLRARWSMDESERIERQIRELLEQRLANLLQQQEKEHARQVERLEKTRRTVERLQMSIAKLKENPQDVIEGDLKRFRREAESARLAAARKAQGRTRKTSARVRQPKKPAGSPPTTTSTDSTEN